MSIEGKKVRIIKSYDDKVKDGTIGVIIDEMSLNWVNIMFDDGRQTVSQKPYWEIIKERDIKQIPNMAIKPEKESQLPNVGIVLERK